jgi:hypothetical protein
VPDGLKAATCDLWQIEAWWRKFPNANIGCVPGRSGYVVLDADLYKQHFAGAELLLEEEQETPTTVTGGGGKHLWFRKPEGVTYSNAPGSLPVGIDVRADNGYVLLPPSQHASGRRYTWMEAHGLRQTAARPLPERIHAALAAAAEAHRHAVVQTHAHTGVVHCKQHQAAREVGRCSNATTMPITAESIAEREAQGRPYSARYCRTGVFQRRLRAVAPAAGRTGLFVVDALVESGGSLLQASLVGRGGRSRYTVRRAVARLEELALVVVDEGSITLAPEWQTHLEQESVLMPTHGNGGRRIVAEAWRLLASCHVAVQQALRAAVVVPAWVKRRQARAWADLERYGP